MKSDYKNTLINKIVYLCQKVNKSTNNIKVLNMYKSNTWFVASGLVQIGVITARYVIVKKGLFIKYGHQKLSNGKYYDSFWFNDQNVKKDVDKMILEKYNETNWKAVTVGNYAPDDIGF
ncbi:MAG TPA: hypothetical protein VI911_12225 [Patescibacteria group bacterium]|nr:hypothetical protein [Patescibacteria group bacterium]